jgi:hypothetical protein
VLALWVAFADLIPLVGATLGAIPTILVALLHSTTAGIAMFAVFVAYQQFENHVLQVTIMSRTVRLNPLTVLVSVLAGVELFGILGALLAIPAAGVLQVILRDLYDHRRGGLKPEPTVGQDEVPVSQVVAEEETAEEDGAARTGEDEKTGVTGSEEGDDGATPRAALPPPAAAPEPTAPDAAAPEPAAPEPTAPELAAVPDAAPAGTDRGPGPESS